MSRFIQISAEVSPRTKELLERYVRATGVKKGFLIEQALLHHIQALEELPAEFIVPRRLVVSRTSGERMLKEVRSSSKPAKALVKLMSRK